MKEPRGKKNRSWEVMGGKGQLGQREEPVGGSQASGRPVSGAQRVGSSGLRSHVHWRFGRKRSRRSLRASNPSRRESWWLGLICI